MYYEENFNGLVTYTGSNWQDFSGTASNPYQEPGVMGTVGDSTYGSDAAYLDDSADSNGTYRMGNTTNGAIRFSYTFTGTGTSFFGRTGANTGYLQIKVEGNGVNELYYRDTKYKAEGEEAVAISGGYLYNVPLFTINGLDYGEYTVTVTVAKAGTIGNVVGEGEALVCGSEFYLDGIRIMEPMNWSDTSWNIADTAYDTDGESSMEVVTLRNKLLKDIEDMEDGEDTGFVTFTDTDGTVTTAEEYRSIAPKEEVYLLPGQSVSFAIKGWTPDGWLLHLGMKSPTGSGKLQVGQVERLSNTAHCKIAAVVQTKRVAVGVGNAVYGIIKLQKVGGTLVKIAGIGG